MSSFEEFITIKSLKGPFEIKEKGSRFISYIYPVNDNDQAEKYLNEFRKKYFDSTHVCFGYRIGEGFEKSVRYSDDGEPGGTAGLPIINEIRGQALFNVLVVVIRYFGGTKLGTGGLARAYRDAAKLSIKNSENKKVILKRSVRIMIPYNFLGELMKIVSKFSLVIGDKKYLEKGIRIELDIPVSKFEIVKKSITNSSKGNVTFSLFLFFLSLKIF